MKIDFDIKLGKWALFSILVIVILCGSYYSLFGLREGFEPGTCPPKGCMGHQVDPDGNCHRYNVEDGYNTFYVKISGTDDGDIMPISLNIPAGLYTGDSLATIMQTLILGIGNPATSNFTCKFHDSEYKKPGTKDVDLYVNQLEFNLNNKDDSTTSTTVTILFVLNAPYDKKTSLESLFKTKNIILTGITSQFTGLNLTNPYFPSSLTPTSICPQVCAFGGYDGGITKDKDYCQYDKDCSACATTICSKGICPDPGPKPTPPPSPSKKGGKGGGGGGGGGGEPDCSQAKCYAQPLAGTNDQFNQFDPYNPKDPGNPKYDEDTGFCGISNTDENGMRFMFGCNSTSSCTSSNLDCKTECKRKDGKIIGNCQEYPCTKGVNWNKKDCVVKNPGKSDPGSSGKGDNSGYNYYDSDMDDYMNELMKPGKMTPNQMYNFSQARYGCDASKYGCCADGFTYKKDASGNNCFDFLPYYNPILFRGGA